MLWAVLEEPAPDSKLYHTYEEPLCDANLIYLRNQDNKASAFAGAHDRADKFRTMVRKPGK